MEFKRNPSWYHVQAKMMAAQAVLDQEDVQLHDIDEVSVRNTHNCLESHCYCCSACTGALGSLCY